SPQLLQNTDDIIFVTASAFVADTLQHQSVLVDKAAKDRSLSQRIDEGNGGPKVAGTNTIKCTDFIEGFFGRVDALLLAGCTAADSYHVKVGRAVRGPATRWPISVPTVTKAAPIASGRFG